MNPYGLRPARRVAIALAMGAREYRRTPVLLALLVFLPAYTIGLFTYVAPDATAVLHLDGGAVRVGLNEAFPAFTTPMVAALLTGIAGLFLMQTGVGADQRLSIAGYTAIEVILARLGLLAGVAGVATVVSVAVMRTAFTPAHVGWFALATGLTALIYGMVGVVAGLLLDRLPGVYLVLFGSMVDLFLFQNPLATDSPDVAALLPGHYPLALAMDAGFRGGVAPADFWWSLAVLAVLTTVATGAFYRSMRG